MLSKIFGVLIIASGFMGPIFGCDFSKLDAAAETLSGKIFNSKPMSEGDIKKSLRFVRDENKVDPMYTQAEKFQELWNAKTKEIQNISFSSFAGLCEQIYKEGSFKEKSAVHMLFQEVSSKTQAYLRQQQSRQEEPGLPSGVDIRRAAEEFLNIDKVVPQNFNSSQLVHIY